MKPISLEVDSKDTKRINLPIGRILVTELSALLNGPFGKQKRQVDSSLNEMADRALDDMVKQIHENRDECIKFIEDMRMERSVYNASRPSPPTPVKRRLTQIDDEEEPVLLPPLPTPRAAPAPAPANSSNMELGPITRIKFDSMIFDLQRSFELSDDRGRRIAYQYLRQAKCALEKYIVE